MNIKHLESKLGRFIKETQDRIMSYQQYKADLNEQVKKQLKGSLEAQNLINAMETDIKQFLKSSTQDLKENISYVREVELERIDKNSESITPESLAELTLLSQIELNNDDLTRYVEKYKNNPLAIRKLNSIAKTQNLMCFVPEDKAETLNKILDSFDYQIDYYSNVPADILAPKLDMIVEGNITSNTEKVDAFQAL